MSEAREEVSRANNSICVSPTNIQSIQVLGVNLKPPVQNAPDIREKSLGNTERYNRHAAEHVLRPRGYPSQRG